MFSPLGDNPIIRVAKPWRESSRRRWFYWGLLGFFWIPYPLLVFWISNRLRLLNQSGFLVDLSYILIPLMTALSLHWFGYRHRDIEHLQELSLTQIQPDEAVWGAVYWGALTSAFLTIPLWFTGCYVEWKNHGDPGFQAWALGMTWIASVSAAIRSWIMSYGRVFFILLYTGAIALIFYLLGKVPDQFGYSTLVMSVMGILCFYLVFHSRKFAAERFFAPMNWEILCQAYWLTNELVAFTETTERRASLRQLAVRLGRNFRYSLLIIGVGLLFSWGINCLWLFAKKDLFHTDWIHTFGLLWVQYPVPFFLVVSTITILTMYHHAVRSRNRNDEWPLSSGSIHLSLLRYLREPLTVYGLLSIATVLSTFTFPENSLPHRQTFLMFLEGFILLIGIGLSCLYRSNPFYSLVRWGLWTLLLTFFCLICYFLNILLLDNGDYPFDYDGKIIPILSKNEISTQAWMGAQKAALFFSGIASIYILLQWPRKCQKLHVQYLSRVPRHTLVNIPKRFT